MTKAFSGPNLLRRLAIIQRFLQILLGSAVAGAWPPPKRPLVGARVGIRHRWRILKNLKRNRERERERERERNREKNPKYPRDSREISKKMGKKEKNWL